MGQVAFLRRVEQKVALLLANGANRWELMLAKVAAGSFTANDLAMNLAQMTKDSADVFFSVMTGLGGHPVLPTAELTVAANDTRTSKTMTVNLAESVDPPLGRTSPLIPLGHATPNDLTLSVDFAPIQLAPTLKSREVVVATVIAQNIPPGGAPFDTVHPAPDPGMYVGFIFKGNQDIIATVAVRLT